MSTESFTLFTASCLEKIFADDVTFVPNPSYTKASILGGERFSFQVVYCQNGDGILDGTVSVSGSLADKVIIREVGLVPCELPNLPNADDYVLRTTPGLYPDLLRPFSNQLRMISGQWRSLWITLPANAGLAVDLHDIMFTFSTEEGKTLGSCSFALEQLAAKLPEQTLLHTEWFHGDCIADFYQVPIFSEAHWEWIERYMKIASDYGMNMILTPLFTPPLDTKVGGERTTIQLIDVYKTGSDYQFDFQRLERWLTLCNRAHITYLEFSHFFTQWGAGFAPKIMAYSCSMEERSSDMTPTKIFGWETKSTSDEYRDFLASFLPELMKFIANFKLEKRCYFHVSDEPSKEHLTTYLAAKELLSQFIGDMPIMDALSDYEFYAQGLVKIPVCANNHIEPFLEHKVPDLWTYYCCSQNNHTVSNRFFCMPSLRNRILGLQIYQNDVCGFLHWGFNFYNTAFSIKQVDPFSTTDAGCYFPSGDSFLVYPGKEEPYGSIRGEVLMAGLQDMRAMQLLASFIGTEETKAFIAKDLTVPLTFRTYPHEESWLLALREECNQKIGGLYYESITSNIGS